jgi:hypothetical protein
VRSINPAFSAELAVSLDGVAPMALDERKLIARPMQVDQHHQLVLGGLIDLAALHPRIAG